MKAVAYPILSIVLSTAVSLSAVTAFAQSTARNPSRQTARRSSPIAIVDISYIFKNHAGFKATMERMKSEVQAFEQQLRARHEALEKERKQLSQFRPGSVEYENLERSMADKAAKLQVDAQLKKKEFLQRESKVYYLVYLEVTKAIQDYAAMNGIDLVLRHNGEQINPEDRQSVLQGVNRAVVYQRGLDITREVSDRLNRRNAERVSNQQSRSRSAPRSR